MTMARIGAAAAVAFCAAAYPAHGQQAPAPATAQCLPMAAVASSLLTKYGEQPLWVGKTKDGKALLIFANPSETTWTAFLFVDGKLCPMAAGDAWSLRTMLQGAPA